MSWVYEEGNYLCPESRISSMSDDLLTVDSERVPDALTLGLFKGDGWEIYNPTIHTHSANTHFKFRTTYKKVINNGKV